jgi:hypothetical protein
MHVKGTYSSTVIQRRDDNDRRQHYAVQLKPQQLMNFLEFVFKTGRFFIQA